MQYTCLTWYDQYAGRRSGGSEGLDALERAENADIRYCFTSQVLVLRFSPTITTTTILRASSRKVNHFLQILYRQYCLISNHKDIH
jgi:hypothetical protein